jgi:hypothetical protein
MKPTSEDLYGALWQIGEDSDGEPPRPEVITRLTELKIVEVQPTGRPELTTLGWQLYRELEADDAPPEFEQS